MTEEEVPVDRESAAAVAAALRGASPLAARMVDEHEQYFDEVLSTILLAEVARWYRDALTSDSPDDAVGTVAALAELYVRGDDGVETVIVTGFLEALPHDGEADRWVVEQLPTVLREELRKMEEWRPSTAP